jgi:hypothetical protein
VPVPSPDFEPSSCWKRRESLIDEQMATPIKAELLKVDNRQRSSSRRGHGRYPAVILPSAW